MGSAPGANIFHGDDTVGVVERPPHKESLQIMSPTNPKLQPWSQWNLHHGVRTTFRCTRPMTIPASNVTETIVAKWFTVGRPGLTTRGARTL